MLSVALFVAYSLLDLSEKLLGITNTSLLGFQMTMGTGSHIHGSG